MPGRKPYPTDVSEEEWSFAAPYSALMNEDAPQRRYEPREMFSALRWMARAGASWRMLPTNFPPWEMVHQQTQRWLNSGCFEAMANNLRSVLRVAQERQGQRTVILNGRTLQSTCESDPRGL
jgi:transposase